MKRIILIISIAALLIFQMPLTGCASTDVAATTDASPASPLPAAPVAAGAKDAAITVLYATVIVAEAGAGYALVINVAIHNTGYESFDTAPELFSVTVGGRTYRYDPARSGLKAGYLPDDGKVLGKLTFPVPGSTPSVNPDFTLGYSGPLQYNIQWVLRN